MDWPLRRGEGGGEDKVFVIISYIEFKLYKKQLQLSRSLFSSGFRFHITKLVKALCKIAALKACAKYV